MVNELKKRSGGLPHFRYQVRFMNVFGWLLLHICYDFAIGFMGLND